MLEKLFSSLALYVAAMDCDRDGELRVELNKSADILVGVLIFEHVCEFDETNKI